MQHLEFEAYAKQYFGFLLTERGYRCILSTPDQIRLESSKVFIELAFDGKRSFELDLFIGELGRQPSYSIAEILRLRRAPEAKSLSVVQATTNEVLRSFVQQMANALRTYAGDFVLGNKQSFAELAEQRKREVEAYAIECNLKSARSKSEDAWRSQDYRTVVKALKPVRAFLTPSEIKKLDFAERKTARDPS